MKLAFKIWKNKTIDSTLRIQIWKSWTKSKWSLEIFKRRSIHWSILVFQFGFDEWKFRRKTRRIAKTVGRCQTRSWNSKTKEWKTSTWRAQSKRGTTCRGHQIEIGKERLQSLEFECDTTKCNWNELELLRWFVLTVMFFFYHSRADFGSTQRQYSERRIATTKRNVRRDRWSRPKTNRSMWQRRTAEHHHRIGWHQATTWRRTATSVRTRRSIVFTEYVKLIYVILRASNSLDILLYFTVQDNRELQNRLAQTTTTDVGEMRSMHDEFSILEETG